MTTKTKTKTEEEKTPGIGHNGPDEAWLRGRTDDLRKLGVKLLDNKKLKEVAVKTRATWIEYGTILADVRDAIPSNKMFNGWLKDNDLEAYADRNSRTDAMWLSRQSDELHALIPAELHSPKAIRNWYRKSLKDALAANDGDVDAAKANSDTADFANAVNAGDWDVAVAAYEASQNREKYEDMTAADAAGVILAKLAKHPTPYDVLEAVNKAVEEGALDAAPEDEPEDAGDTDPDADDAGDDDSYDDEGPEMVDDDWDDA